MPFLRKKPSNTDSTKAPKGVAKKIVQKEEQVLRKKAQEVKISDIKSPEIQQIIANMKATLEVIPDGVGLAAPQIGESYRIFIVSGRVFIKPSLRVKIDEYMAKGEQIRPEDAEQIPDDLVCINPVITNYSKEKKWFEGEGCLSVRWLYGRVERSTKVKLQAYDQNGKKFERGATDLLGHIFQHEVDHLNGILFIDKAEDLETLPEQHRNKSGQ